MSDILYKGFMINTERSSRYGRHGLTAEATVLVALSRRQRQTVRAMQSEYLARWDRLSYKIGLQIRRNQRIDRLVYARDGGGEIIMREDPAVTADLAAVLPARAGDRWVGLVPESRDRRKYAFVESNVISFEIALSIAPAQALPQLVPAVVRHRRGHFADRFLGTLWVLTPPS